MKKTLFAALLAAIVMPLSGPIAYADGAYVALGLGLAFEEFDASVAGVNHPTRCDRLLYSDPSDAATDAACTDGTARTLFGDSFDLGAGFAGSASVGYEWDRFRIEAEFFSRSHDSETLPGIADAGNQALLSKDSEWSANSPPYHRVSDFKAQQLFVNVYYTFGEGSAWTPYVGVGAGLARVETNYSASYIRRTVADGYVTAAGGDPAQPEDWQLAAAGSTSILDTEISDTVFGYQLSAGVERQLAEKTAAFLTLRWARYNDLDNSAVWTTIRSHTPVRADGVTPFTTDQVLEDIGGLTATVGIRYAF